MFSLGYKATVGPNGCGSQGESKLFQGKIPEMKRANDRTGPCEVAMAQMTPEVSKMLERTLSISVEEQEALADSLISNLGGKVEELLALRAPTF